MQAPLAHTVQLTVEWLDIENSTGCRGDSVQLVDRYLPLGSDSSHPALQRLCGESSPHPGSHTLNYTSFLHHVDVNFVSDNVTSQSVGFVVTYKVIPGESEEIVIPIERQSH